MCYKPTNIWWSIKLMKLLIMQSSPASRHFLTLRSTYCPKHSYCVVFPGSKSGPGSILDGCFNRWSVSLIKKKENCWRWLMIIRRCMNKAPVKILCINISQRSIFQVDIFTSLCRWRQQGPPKRRYPSNTTRHYNLRSHRREASVILCTFWNPFHFDWLWGFHFLVFAS